jgi:hypothetical protein
MMSGELTTGGLTMSSREIGELTGKQHKDVIRDIRVMVQALEKDGADLRHLREEKDGRGYTKAIHLDRELTETLITGYSIPLRHRVIRRLHELEEAQAVPRPAEFAQGVFQEFQATRLELITTVADMTEQSLRVADLMGLKDNQGRFYADKLVKRQIGVGPLELLGLTALPSGNDALYFTPKDLGERVGMSPQSFNKLLQRLGYQEPERKGRRSVWRHTLKGEPWARYEDTARQHSDGAPVTALRWKAEILDELKKDAADLGRVLRPVARG